MKKMLFYQLVICLTACNHPVTSEINNRMNEADENTKIVKQMFAQFNAHDWKAMADFYADTAQMRDPSFGINPVPQTKTETIQKYTELNKLFSDIKDSIIAIYASGTQHVIAEFTSTGTGPDGKKFILPICSIFTIENGKITKDYTYYDNSGSK